MENLQNNDEKFTKKVINQAFIKVLSKEMDYFDAYYTDIYVDKLCEENMQLKVNDGTFDKDIANDRIDYFKHLIPKKVLSAYGWSNYDVKQAIIKYLPDEYKQLFLKQNYDEDEGEM